MPESFPEGAPTGVGGSARLLSYRRARGPRERRSHWFPKFKSLPPLASAGEGSLPGLGAPRRVPTAPTLCQAQGSSAPGALGLGVPGRSTW